VATGKKGAGRGAESETARLRRRIAELESALTAARRTPLDETRLNALLDLNQMADRSLQEITDYALEQAVALTGSDIGYLAFMNDDESVLTMHSWSKTAMKQCAIIDKPIVYPVASTGLWGEAVRQRRAVITNDYAAPNQLKKGYPDGHVQVRRHMNAPVMDGSRIVLVAGVGNKVAPYDDGDVRQLTLLMQGMWRLVQRKRAEDLIASQAREILEVSTPVMMVADGVLVAPLIGTFHEARARRFIERLLECLVESSVRVVLVDITGVSTVDSHTARYLGEAAAAVRLMGARIILTGMRPAIAQTLIHLGVDLGQVETCGSLKAGLATAARL
jgi:anti-anti-sigma regulatory factor